MGFTGLVLRPWGENSNVSVHNEITARTFNNTAAGLLKHSTVL
jgi:hypothetical protein